MFTNVTTIEMIINMSIVTALYVSFSAMLWIWVNNEPLSKVAKVIIGIFYGIFSILSTHFGVNYGNMLLNIRDLGPLIAGLFFDPLSGIIAGTIGGFERYYAGTCLNIGAYTTIACSVSTFLAGIFAAIIRIKAFDKKLITIPYAVSIGAVMEVFHMYAVIVTHRDDMVKAFTVVKICSIPMIIFSAIGLSLSAMMINKYTSLSYSEEKIKTQKSKSQISVLDTFHNRLLIMIILTTAISLSSAFYIQTESAYQNASATLSQGAENIKIHYENNDIVSNDLRVGNTGTFCITNQNGDILFGSHQGETFSDREMAFITRQFDKEYFDRYCFDTHMLCRSTKLGDNNILLVMIPTEEVFWYRDAQAYEQGLFAILLFVAMYVFISYLVGNVIVNKLKKVNLSLSKITNGNLEEVVEVKDSLEFAELSNDINKTVDSLKNYMAEEKRRSEKELQFAREIQLSALPQKFNFNMRYKYSR